MKSQMRNLAIVFALLAAACGGKETTASKSAAALRDTQAKGVPVGGDGHEHGHGGEAATTTAVDHSAHGTTTDAQAAMDHSTIEHSTMDHGTMDHGTMDHSKMAPADHAAMGHATTASRAHAGHGTSRSATTHAGHGASRTVPSEHGGHTPSSSAPSAHAGHTPSATAPSHHAGHGQTAAPASAHAGHGATHATPPAVDTRPPSSNAEIARTQPAATLRGDEFDAPVATSVSEAAKAAGGGGSHAGHDAAAVYTCPMHPEVTSSTPGTCPKCGMALVRKEGK